MLSVQFSSVQLLSRVWLFETPWIAARQASLSITNTRSSLKLMSIESWCHPAISSSVVPFSSCPQSLPPSESFPMSQLFAWGGQRTGVSALSSFLPKNTQGWSPLEWTQGSPHHCSRTLGLWGGQSENYYKKHLSFQDEMCFHGEKSEGWSLFHTETLLSQKKFRNILTVYQQEKR